MELGAYISLFIYFFAASIYDVKDREIPLFISAAAACLLFAIRLYFVCRSEMAIQTAFLGVAIGIALLIISVLSKGEIGAGDGILFIVSGFVFGFYENGVLLFVSLAFAAIAGGVLIVVKRVGRKYELPFAPFVFAGYGVICIWKMFG